MFKKNAIKVKWNRITKKNDIREVNYGIKHNLKSKELHETKSKRRRMSWNKTLKSKKQHETIPEKKRTKESMSAAEVNCLTQFTNMPKGFICMLSIRHKLELLPLFANGLRIPIQVPYVLVHYICISSFIEYYLKYKFIEKHS